MGIFDIFTPKPEPAPTQPVVAQPVQPVQGTPPNQGNIPPAPTVVTDPNNSTAPVIEPVAPVEKDESPLAEFSKLWDTDPNKKENEPAQPVPLDQTKVQEIVAKADFSKNIPQELLADITEGGEKATVAMAKMMNHVAQQVMTQSIVANNKLNEKVIKDALAAQLATLPGMLREQSSANHLKTKNPIFDNPAIKPVMEAAHQQFLQKFPNDTNEQTAERVERYILAMGEQFAPKPVVDPNSDGEQDWSNFIPEG